MASVMDFYGKDISPFALDIWWEALKQYDYEAVTRALSLYCGKSESGQFAPKPADITKIIEGGSGDKALIAWSRVDKAVRQIGPYQTVVFDDPIIHQVISDMGGWIQLCDGDDNDWPFKAREFENRYRAYALNGVKEYPQKLIGMAEHHNQNLPKPFPTDPVLIGNHEQAKLVLEGGKENSGLETSVLKLTETKKLN